MYIYGHFLSKFQFFHSFWFEKWRGGQLKSVILYKQIACCCDRKLDRADDCLLFDRIDATLLITARPPDCLGCRSLNAVTDCFLCVLSSSILGNILLLFMGITTKFSVHQAVVIAESRQHRLPGRPLILEFSQCFFLFFPNHAHCL